MRETNQKLDNLLAKAGQMNNYQFLVTLLFLIQIVCAEFFNQSLPFLEKGPYVFIGDSKESVIINRTICNNKNSTYTLDENNIPKSIVMDFEIYCNKSKIFFIGFILDLGMIIGSCASFLFTDKIGRKKALKIFIPMHIILLCLFKFLKPEYGSFCLYLIYINTFLLGIVSYIIIITIFIYICEIIKQTDIPIFVLLLITGVPLSGLLSSLFFNFKSFDWRNSLLIIAGINLIVYIFIISKLVRSPIFSLNNELFETFIFDLLELGRKNGVDLNLNDFEFLDPYIANDKKVTIYNKYMQRINKIDGSIVNNSSIKNSISFKNGEMEENLVDKNNEIYKKETEKDENLLAYNNESSTELIRLFDKFKMKDYSPLDLLRYEIKNFFVLSFLWSATMLINNGINLESKYIQKIYEKKYLRIIKDLLEIIIYYIILSLYLKPKLEFHELFVFWQLLSFILFMILLYTDLDAHGTGEILLIFFVRSCWGCAFSLLFIITNRIYSIMIRTKGLGWNISFGFIGAILSNLIIEITELRNQLYIYLIINFFSLVISYGLPNKVGTFILETPSKKTIKKDKNNETLVIRNTLFMKDNLNETVDKSTYSNLK